MKPQSLRLTRSITLLLFLVVLVVLGQLSGNEPHLDAIEAAQQVTGLALESQMVNVGSVTLHVVQAGAKDGPPIVLLHGFPEFWYAWRDVIPPLVAEGYRVIVPDQRGYGDSDKPRGIEAYKEDALGDDVAGLIQSLGYQNACIAAHDVGGGVAWNLAFRHPEQLNHLVLIDTYHPNVLQKINSHENKISWYRMAFQIPLLPEWSARLFHWSIVTTMLRNTAVPNAFSEDKLRYYRSAWDREGAFPAMVNWYRAYTSNTNLRIAERRVSVPTLILLAPQDAFIPSDLVRASLTLLDDGELIELSEGTHWVMQEHPEVIAREIAAFCKNSS